MNASTSTFPLAGSTHVTGATATSSVPNITLPAHNSTLDPFAHSPLDDGGVLVSIARFTLDAPCFCTRAPTAARPTLRLQIVAAVARIEFGAARPRAKTAVNRHKLTRSHMRAKCNSGW